MTRTQHSWESKVGVTSSGDWFFVGFSMAPGKEVQMAAALPIVPELTQHLHLPGNSLEDRALQVMRRAVLRVKVSLSCCWLLFLAEMKMHLEH